MKKPSAVHPISMAIAIALLAGCGGGSSGSSLSPAPQPPPPTPPPPGSVIDIATLSANASVTRVSGSASTGRFGVPVAAGFDIDGDGFGDIAMSGMQASPMGRDRAGQVWVLFGDGTAGTDIDTAAGDPRLLVIAGATARESAGSEIWMDDVTGDGLGDLVIGRHTYTEPVAGRIGAGALTVIVGNAMLRDLATNGTVFDLAAPPAGIAVLTLIGASELDRLGFWMRTGDVSGDGIADVVVSADQEDAGGDSNVGALYLVRGGAHLDASLTVDLAIFGATPLAGQIAKITPPSGSADYHFGATATLADLDNNGRAEVLVAASLSRVGGLLEAEGAPAGSGVRNGGNPGGSLFILWDDNFPAGAQWADGLSFATDNAPGSISRIDGGSLSGTFANQRFGEEILGGLDYDGDSEADLFVGDIKGTAGSDRVEGGVGHVFFSAAQLLGRSFSMTNVPSDIRVTHLLGPTAGAISSDTSLHGDIDGDGTADLVIASPLDDPNGRQDAGTIHVLWGQPGPWPALIDLADGARPAQSTFAITDIQGAAGATSADDTGDTLMYSAIGADVDGDGLVDLVVNEMRGNGIAGAALDVGNLLIIGGDLVAAERPPLATGDQ